ncbi:hypothetical protein [Pseudomonas borbori]|uniref:Uncharacterized protein n=1 Tax=Pseudomonas borbori TaxID=289003 RepID=A0A1I5TBJ5_9PSED|nr:hypothetical protein [Pseudomonas borbori]SFP80191.1 hypothetical protein SAMN05216190_11959 [Pseudomonas borbori]
MDELLALITAGALIPAISLLVKKLIIDNAFKALENEISIKDKDGKEFKFVVNSNATSNEIRDIFESELKFESSVKKSLENFINTHKKNNLHLSHGKNLDFLLRHNDRRIGIEAKSNANKFKAKWILNYFKENNEIDELIMIIDSKIPETLLKEVNNFDKGKKIKFISSPGGRGLSKSINNVLEADLGINKTLHRTSR